MVQAHETQYPELRWLFHIPNGGARDAITGARLKAEGVKPGVPDLCLPVARQGHTALYVEMKYGRNKPAPVQEEWLTGLTDLGARCVVCYSAQEAFTEIMAYLRGATA